LTSEHDASGAATLSTTVCAAAAPPTSGAAPRPRPSGVPRSPFRHRPLLLRTCRETTLQRACLRDRQRSVWRTRPPSRECRAGAARSPSWNLLAQRLRSSTAPETSAAPAPASPPTGSRQQSALCVRKPIRDRPLSGRGPVLWAASHFLRASGPHPGRSRPRGFVAVPSIARFFRCWSWALSVVPPARSRARRRNGGVRLGMPSTQRTSKTASRVNLNASRFAKGPLSMCSAPIRQIPQLPRVRLRSGRSFSLPASTRSPYAHL